MGVMISSRNGVGIPGPQGIQGIPGASVTGPQGAPGKGFQIISTYPSDAALLAAVPSPSQIGEFGIVSSLGADNTDLYLWQGVGPGWLFISKLSAGVPVVGPAGSPGATGGIGPAGPAGTSYYALIGTLDATSGIAVGTHALASSLGAKVIVQQAFMAITSTFTSATSHATVALQVIAANDLLGAITITDLPALGGVDLVPNSSGNDITTVGVTFPAVVVGTEALTGGRALIFALLAQSI